jgi:integrase
MALTFVRTGELIGARWTEIDFEEKRWNIPATRMKMRTPHIVPLSTQAIEVLKTLHTLTGSHALLFPGDRNEKKPMSNNTILKGLHGLVVGFALRAPYRSAPFKPFLGRGGRRFSTPSGLIPPNLPPSGVGFYCTASDEMRQQKQ